MDLPGRTYVLRHGETVFNAALRLQGDAPHTPLTREGFRQIEAVGQALAEQLGDHPPLTVWTSDAGRARQSWAILAEHLGFDWFDARVDARLAEIGMGSWGGLSYSELKAEGRVFDGATGWLTEKAPGGEWFDDIADRLTRWIGDAREDEGDRLVVMHGLSSRVLRGLLTNAPVVGGSGTPLAPALPQGSIVVIRNERETVLRLGEGGTHS